MISSQVKPDEANDMYIVEHLKRIFKEEFGEEAYRFPNRASTVVVIVQHGFTTIQPLMEAFLALKVPANHLFMTTKPHTTSQEMLEYFKRGFANYIPFQWEGDIAEVNYNAKNKESHYKRKSAVTYKVLLDKLCDFLLRSTSGANIKNIIVCDEGGKFLKLFIDRYNNPDTSKYNRNLSAYNVVAIEHTRCGTYTEALGCLPFPLINMAESFVKTKIEAEFIAKDMLVNLGRILERILRESNGQPLKVGIVGLGSIGTAVLRFLQEKYKNLSLIIFDVNATLMTNAQLERDKFDNIERAERIEDIFLKAEVVLGCVGKDIAATLPDDFFTQTEILRSRHLISCSSGDVEFLSLLLQMPGYKFESISDICDWVMKLEDGKEVVIYNGGFPINFTPNISETMPKKYVQVTRGMKLAALVQAFKLLEVIPLKTINEESLYKKLDVTYQWEIIQALYQDLLSDATNEEKEKYKYREITREEIANGSMGVTQPSLDAQLNIPHYVSTNNQVKLNEQLESQSNRVKCIAIIGTTGSGKTVLAQQHLQKYRLQHPGHLTKVLVAEARSQWDFELRNWAIELTVGLENKLKETPCIKAQQELVIKSIQAAFSKTPWCVVIDNWDVNEGPHITEIDGLFYDENVDTGTGTYLVTTQAQSPYDDNNCSLDISMGLAADESRKLLTKVINIEEKTHYSWQDLGGEIALNKLAEKLGHLPLALVIAGSYICWENKTRANQGVEPFTYENYQSMLSEHVEEFTADHDEKLGDRARVPRDRSREEFRRLKTQEAAVKLSLKKTIVPDSDKKNTVLWLMLCFCGFLAPDGIPQLFLRNLLKMINQAELDSAFRQLLGLTQQYALLQFENRKSYLDDLPSLHMHRVIQKVLRDIYWPMFFKVSSESNAEVKLFRKLQFAIMNPLTEIVPERNVEKTREILPHLDAWAMQPIFQNDVAVAPVSMKSLVEGGLGSAYHLLGDYAKAEILLRDAIASQIAFYGTERHVHVAYTQSDLAEVLISRGDWLNAESLMKEALDVANGFLPNGRFFVEKMRLTYSSLLRELGRYDEANTFASNLNDPGARISQANLKMAMGDYVSALKIYEEELERLQSFYASSDHIDVATAQQALASALANVDRSKLDRAKTLAEDALATLEKHFGSTKHLRVAGAQQCLANICVELEDYIAAESLFKEALKTSSELIESKENIRLAELRVGLVRSMRNNDINLSGCKMLLSEAESIAINHFKIEKHFQVAKIQNNLAGILQDMKDFDAAKALFEKVINTKASHYGTKKNVDVAITQQNLAFVLVELKCYDDALCLLNEADGTFKSTSAGLQYLERSEYARRMISQEKFYNNIGKEIRAAAGKNNLQELINHLDIHPLAINQPDGQPNRGWTALHWAIDRLQISCVDELLKRNASYNIPDRTDAKKTAIDLCIEKGNFEIKELFIVHLVNKYLGQCYTGERAEVENALEKAVECEDSGAIKLFLEWINNENQDHLSVSSAVAATARK